MRTAVGTPEPKVVVGLDFGTTYSGFAFAFKTSPTEIYTHNVWPQSEQRNYCKTKTELFYTRDSTGKLTLQSWGCKASADQIREQAALKRDGGTAAGELVTKFKLHLADTGNKPESSAPPLPAKLTKRIVITDYLRELSKFCMNVLKRAYGERWSMRDVQWCLTVPAMWDDLAKQRMRNYAEDAGLIQKSGSSSEGSPHALRIVLEPEAASIFCLKIFNNQLSIQEGDTFMTADLGGGTADIVVHEYISSGNGEQECPKVKEKFASIGDLCGATYVDKRFMSFLAARIGCLESFLRGNPSTRKHILRWWENVKCVFDGVQSSETMPLTTKLSEAWKLYDAERGATVESAEYYAEIEITRQDLVNVFDPVVNDVTHLIGRALESFRRGEVKVLLAVGGFSGCPYLLKRLKEEFLGQVGEVVCPPEPGSAVIKGAVMLGISQEDLVISRVCRRTYGLAVFSTFQPNDPPELKFKGDDGVVMCNQRFRTFACRGEEIPTNHVVDHIVSPTFQNQKCLRISIYSSAKENPSYCIPTPDDYTVRKESHFKLDISAGLDLDRTRKIKVTMFFGRTSIQVTAEGYNFNASGGAAEVIPLEVEEVESDSLSVEMDEIPGMVGPAVTPEDKVQKRCCVVL